MKFPEEFRYSAPGYESSAGSPYGMFIIPSRAAKGRRMLICACDAGEPVAQGWEHVSVSLPDMREKCPSWPEMCLVKDLFWAPEQCVVQFHPPASEYVNQHAGCLHLWHQTRTPMVTPPKILVGLQ